MDFGYSIAKEGMPASVQTYQYICRNGTLCHCALDFVVVCMCVCVGVWVCTHCVPTVGDGLRDEVIRDAEGGGGGRYVCACVG